MTDKEFLLAISSMLDPMREDIRELQGDIRELKGEMHEVKGDIHELKGEMHEVKGDIHELKEEMHEVKGDIRELKERVKRIETTQEMVIVPRVEHIEDCYTSTYDRYREGVEEHIQMKEDISLIKQVVTKHSEKLQKIS